MNDERWWCRHFTGIHYSTCKADISYSDVSIEKNGRLEYPCYDKSIIGVCMARKFWTQAEWDEQQKAVAAMLAKFTDYLNGKTNICPHCGKEVIRERQVGRCVYGEPCGCRLYQGKRRSSHETHT